MLIQDYYSQILPAISGGVLAFSLVYRKIEDYNKKRWFGTIFGIFLACIILRSHVFQHLFMLASSLLIIRAATWRKCHIYTTLYTLTYITVFRILHTNLCYHSRIEITLVQMVAVMKIIGLSFDVHLSNKAKDKNDNIDETEEAIDPNFMDLFHYLCSYLGILSGPFTRYRTYNDFLKLPFSRHSDPTELCIRRFSMCLLCYTCAAVIFFACPIEYIVTEEFRKSHFLYKNALNFLYLLRFKMWMTSGLYAYECMSGLIGMGAYPKQAKAITTHGPTEKYDHLKYLSEEEGKTLEYDFETLNTMNFAKIITTPWHFEFWRNWNLTSQYCMGRYIHKELFGSPFFKDYRIILTMLVSSIWHGIEFGYYSSLVLSGVYIISEKPYYKLYQSTKGWVSTCFLVVMWFIQAHIFSHLMVSFIVLRMDVIRIHASAMNYVPYVSLLFFYLIGKLLSTIQKNIKY